MARSFRKTCYTVGSRLILPRSPYLFVLASQGLATQSLSTGYWSPRSNRPSSLSPTDLPSPFLAFLARFFFLDDRCNFGPSWFRFRFAHPLAPFPIIFAHARLVNPFFRCLKKGKPLRFMEDEHLRVVIDLRFPVPQHPVFLASLPDKPRRFFSRLFFISHTAVEILLPVHRCFPETNLFSANRGPS